jgi:carbon monoxide dehydrogenase subunit G
MDFKGRYNFDAAPNQVFDAMTNPCTVAACLPGCDALEPLGDNRYQATMMIGVAAIKGRFKGTVELRDLERPVSYTLRVAGKGTLGFAKGQARIEIGERGSSSSVAVEAKAQVGGPVARVGHRLLAGTTKMVADKFFACLRKKVEADSAAASAG